MAALIMSSGMGFTAGSFLTLNPLAAKFFIGNVKMYLQFISFLHADMTQVVEIFPNLRQ